MGNGEWGMGIGSREPGADSGKPKAESRQPIADSLDWGLENREPRQRLFLQPGCRLTYFLYRNTQIMTDRRDPAGAAMPMG